MFSITGYLLIVKIKFCSCQRFIDVCHKKSYIRLWQKISRQESMSWVQSSNPWSINQNQSIFQAFQWKFYFQIKCILYLFSTSHSILLNVSIRNFRLLNMRQVTKISYYPFCISISNDRDHRSTYILVYGTNITPNQRIYKGRFAPFKLPANKNFYFCILNLPDPFLNLGK